MNPLLVVGGVVALVLLLQHRAAALPDSIDAAISQASRRFGIREKLIRAVIRVESSGNVNAIGKAGEVGLMQIMRPALIDANKFAGTRYTFNDLLDGRINVLVGTAYLAWIKNALKTNDELTILRAYNAGIGRISNPLAGREYAQKVLSYA